MKYCINIQCNCMNLSFVSHRCTITSRVKGAWQHDFSWTWSLYNSFSWTCTRPVQYLLVNIRCNNTISIHNYGSCGYEISYNSFRPLFSSLFVCMCHHHSNTQLCVLVDYLTWFKIKVEHCSSVILSWKPRNIPHQNQSDWRMGKSLEGKGEVTGRRKVAWGSGISGIPPKTKQKMCFSR